MHLSDHQQQSDAITRPLQQGAHPAQHPPPASLLPSCLQGWLLSGAHTAAAEQPTDGAASGAAAGPAPPSALVLERVRVLGVKLGPGEGVRCDVNGRALPAGRVTADAARGVVTVDGLQHALGADMQLSWQVVLAPSSGGTIPAPS